mmetsp:Transcript_26907/g.60150  ORF Transcript_26907/g.60150 Transcript_26907/m.60150 type:complete len:274 (+) Transcript_26907:585-1406(+)
MENSQRSRTSGMHRSTAFQSTWLRFSLSASYSSDPGVICSHASYGSPPELYTWMTCFPGGQTEGSRSEGIKKEQRFCESWRERPQSWTMRCAGSSMWDRSSPSASMARKRCRMAPWRGSLPSESLHFFTPSGNSCSVPSIFTVSKGVALETTACFALITLPFLRRTPTARPSLTMISSTWALVVSLPPNFSMPRTSVLAISMVPPSGTAYAAPSSKKRSRMYSMCAVMAPLAGNPQKMHMVSMKLRRKGSVTIWSTVLCRESKVRGRSRNTSG